MQKHILAKINAAQAPKSTPVRRPLCSCGTCVKCRHRAAARLSRFLQTQKSRDKAAHNLFLMEISQGDRILQSLRMRTAPKMSL